MQVSAATFGQRITMSRKNISLKTVLRELTKQSGYGFFYDGKAIGDNQKVTVVLSNAEFDEALKSVLTGLNLSYKIDGNIVSIRKIEEPSLLDNLIARFQAIDVSGRVVDVDGRGLPGASVSVKGKGNKAVSTGTNGSFYLKGVNEDATLIISFIGYVTKEIKAAKELGDVVLELSTSKLDEVQVIAYGTTTRRLSTGNVGTIKGEEISKQPVSNLLLAMQGRIPGIYLNQTSGIAGASVKVRVQGENSLKNGNEAFYVIDGVPYAPQNLYSGINGAFTGTGSALNYINPSDVESIEVLKDADATSIYGSRAANGAILITTKKGKAGKTKIDINMQSGWGEITEKMKLLNTEQYLDMRFEAIKNANRQPRASEYDINGVWDQKKYTDWQDKLIGNTSHYTNLQATISGGNNETQFFSGGGYTKETTVFPGDFFNVKANANMGINHTSADKRFEFNISARYLQDDNRLPTTDLTSVAFTIPPNAPDMYNADGTINWAPKPGSPNSSTFIYNPAAYLLQNYRYRVKTDNLLNKGLIGYTILPNLSFKTSFGYNRLQTEELNTTPQAAFPPLFTDNRRTAIYGNKSITSWIFEPQLSYDKEFLFGEFNFLLGSSFQSTKSGVTVYKGSNYANDDQLETSLAAGTLVSDRNTMQSQYRYNAIFSRLSYNFKSRYLLNISARRDGSSRFGSQNLFHSFYSIGAGWVFSDESWFKDKSSIISFGKFRASYGTTGNDQIQDYQFLSLYSLYPVNLPYQQNNGILPVGLSNPFIQWEETKKLSLGMDMGLFNDRILFNANYYRNRSSNQLLSYPLPSLTGFISVIRNIPALVQNSGFEFSIEGSPIRRDNFKWQVSANLTLPKSKLISYENLDQSAYNDIYVIGQSTNIVKVYEFAGVNQENGFYQFKTFDGKITSTPDYSTDRTKLIDLGPKLFGGLNNSLTYKNFDLSFLFQFVKQVGPNLKFGNAYPGIAINQPSSILQHWKQNGDISNIQKVSASVNSFNSFDLATSSDAAYSDASFIRLKTFMISYLVPINLKKVNSTKIRIYVQGQNLFTITKSKDFDPETGLGILPPLKIISTGFQLTF